MPQPKKPTFAEKKAKKAEAAAFAAAEKLKAISRQDQKCIGELNTFDKELKARKARKKLEEVKAQKVAKANIIQKERMPTIEEEENYEYELCKEF